VVVGKRGEQTRLEHVDRNNGMLSVYGWTCGQTGKASCVPPNSSASTSWILVKLDMCPQCAPVSSRASSWVNSGFPGNSSRSWLKSCRAPVKFFSRISAMARRMRA
jgi:hypothetical protein